MAIVVEDGTGLATAESYVSVAEADAYHVKYGNTSWASLDTAVKEGLLRKAIRYLDAKYGGRWKGVKRSSAQGLAWPRLNATDGEGYGIDISTIPWAVKNAQSELALKANSEELVPDLEASGAIESESVQVGPIKETTTYVSGKGTEKQYSLVEGLLCPLLNPVGKLSR